VADAHHSVSPDPIQRIAKPQRAAPTRQNEATGEQAIPENLSA
jgi:hypothetical protein